jgi:hypothetical protein
MQSARLFVPGARHRSCARSSCPATRAPPPVTPQEIAMMEDLFAVFRHCVGRYASRDWSIINLLAIGLTPRDVAKRTLPKITVRAVEDRKLCQCGAIAKVLAPLMQPE